MDAQKVDMFLMANAKCFEAHLLPQVKEKLLGMDDSKWNLIQLVPRKEPTVALILSVVFGSFGVDRFYIGDTGLGVGKLLTCGGFGVWAIIDWFLIQDATRRKNYEALMML